MRHRAHVRLWRNDGDDQVSENDALRLVGTLLRGVGREDGSLSFGCLGMSA